VSRTPKAPPPVELVDCRLDEVVGPGSVWTGIVPQGLRLRLIDLEGQQAVDFLCYDAADPDDRYNATNTLKVQGHLYVGEGSVLYADSGAALFTVVADSIGQHDTIYGCCSEANNALRYQVSGTANCYDNFLRGLARHGLDRRAIVSNVNFFMQVPVEADGRLGVADEVSPPGSYVDLRAERDVLVVLSNCPQIHNPCNGYNPTPVRVVIGRT
jgi:urea carboxylase-associated protein 1